MTTTFGVTPNGFVRKTLRDILDSLSTAQKATIAATLDTSSESVLGQVNGIFARELGINWEQLEVLYHSNDPDAAEGIILTMLAKLTGTLRRPATQSTVTLTCNLNATTALVAGTHFANVDGRPDVRWTPKSNYEAETGGEQDIIFVSEAFGPIAADAETITVINTPVTGWLSCINAADAAPGRVADTDPTLRLRRQQELAAAGSTTIRAIIANCVQAFPGILNITAFENDSDYTDPDTGNPPHSIEVLFYDGAVPTVDNDAIAQVIASSKAGGIPTVGNTSGTATLLNGQTKEVRFSRSSLLLVYVDYTVKTATGYVGDTALKEYVATTANTKYQPGGDVVALAVEAMPLDLAGVKDILTFRIGTSPSPSGTTNIAVGLRQIARFDTSRITVSDA